MDPDQPIETHRLASLARTSLLGMASGASPMPEIMNRFGFSQAHAFLTKWMPFDFTTLALILTVLGTLPSAFRDLHLSLVKLYWWIARFFTASISIASRDRLNVEVLGWLAHEVLTRQGTRVLTAASESVHRDRFLRDDDIRERDDFRDEKLVPIQYLPTFGTTWFIFEGTLFVVRRIPGKNSNCRNGLTGTPAEYADVPNGMEPLVIICLGRSVNPIKRFLEHCRSFAEKHRDSYITVRASRSKEYREETWDTTILRPLRPLETVHFDETVKQELVNDIKNYLDPATRNFYTSRGIPYRRGYLLHGPPGTGKTSLSFALAGYLNLDLYLLHLPSVKSDSSLEGLFTTLPPKCIVLLEDIDAVGIKDRDFSNSDEQSDDEADERAYTRRSNRNRSECTLSGLLNVLDGVASQEGRIVLMTSNMADKLDRALIRPGRIDKMIFLGKINHGCAEQMFLRMYAADEASSAQTTSGFGDANLSSEQLRKLAVKFGQNIPSDSLTPAQLQGYLLRYRNSPTDAVKNVKSWAGAEVKTIQEAERRNEEAMLKKRKRKSQAKLLSRAMRGMMDSETEVDYDEPLPIKTARDEMKDVVLIDAPVPRGVKEEAAEVSEAAKSSASKRRKRRKTRRN